MHGRQSGFYPTFIGVLLVSFTIMISFACDLSSEGEIYPSKPDEEIWSYEIIFTDPGDPNNADLRGGPDQRVADAIRAARTSVDIAAQYLDLWSIRDALIDAHQRGVKVRMVAESNFLGEKEIQDLVEVGIPVLGDRREGLMHNKFVVIDRKEVWTGSMNYSVNGAYRNDNNLVHIRSIDIAENYTAEFEEMFLNDRFGPGSPANTPNRRVELDNTLFEVYFSPEDGTLEYLLDLVRSADESIYIMAFSFTADELASALVERAKDGVTVAGVFEETQYYSNTGSDIDWFFSEGLDVRLDGNPNSMHHKVIIIDEEIVITGSYNFSRSAETRNDENTLVIHSPATAVLFIKEFQRVFLDAESFD